jgi:hypothetical protein
MESTVQILKVTSRPKRDSGIRAQRISFATMLACVYGTFPPGGDFPGEESQSRHVGNLFISMALPPRISNS